MSFNELGTRSLARVYASQIDRQVCALVDEIERLEHELHEANEKLRLIQLAHERGDTMALVSLIESIPVAVAA